MPEHEAFWARFKKSGETLGWVMIGTVSQTMTEFVSGTMWIVPRQIDNENHARSTSLESEIMSRHFEYSKCMADIVQFSKKFKTNDKHYVKEFLDGMEKEKRSEEIVRINDCRSLTKDWWRLVAKYSEHFGIDEESKPKYAERYRLFKSLVEPLDRLKDRNDLLDNKLYGYGMDLEKMTKKK
ncbi:hypothetical protein C9374_011552 [Naegleria lovaniensis]|uniref:Uncharacterized protein n=1 Tax=Naegleria lovaniensis TaxID=51637 RepID=A0AA88KR06_NAELO|nr:uncharacterized protein C9374_011552 [Naegleria lovaniensis]KAG2392827.1 hypothetical protein C9374_011552 [Naegleria lovaniensis]